MRACTHAHTHTCRQCSQFHLLVASWMFKSCRTRTKMLVSWYGRIQASRLSTLYRWMWKLQAKTAHYSDIIWLLVGSNSTRTYRWISHSRHLCAGLRRKYGLRRVRKSEMLASSFWLISLDWMLRSMVWDAELNRVSWNSKKAASIPSSSSRPVQPDVGQQHTDLSSAKHCGKRFRVQE